MEFIASILRLATPLIFASGGGLLSERSGVVNIALEGLMLSGAFVAAAVAISTGNAGYGWVAGFAGGALMAALYAVAVIEAKADQIVAGTAINLLAIGLIPFFSKIIFDSTGSTPSLPLENRLSWEPIALAFLSMAAIAFVMKRTRVGLWISFAGEHPQALAAAGVSVRKVRWMSLLVGGGLAGWGGATLSLALASSYSPMMTAGRGFIALAALITGRWRPGWALLACLGFALIDLMQIRWQGAELFGTKVPVQLIQILPYVLTIVALAGFLGASRAPKALGKDLDGKEIA